MSYRQIALLTGHRDLETLMRVLDRKDLLAIFRELLLATDMASG